MPLGERPRLVASGWVVHGQRVVDRWCIPESWTLHAYEYEADLGLDGRWFKITPGSVGIIAPGVRQEYRYRGASRHIYAHFALPRTGATTTVPVLHHLGPAFSGFFNDFAVVAREASFEPLRAEVRLWDLLWRLARIAAEGQRAGPPPVLRDILTAIDRDLAGPIAVAAVARRFRLSDNHLTRLFRSHLGTTVVAWLRRRRAERARELLLHSDLAIAEIGLRVGLPDPHRLNKVLRREFGQAPRLLRRSAPSLDANAGRW